MTDFGQPDLMRSGSRDRDRLLRQIAETLSVPVATFHGRRVSPLPGPSASECATLLSAFCRITDPDRRRQCIRMVEGWTET
jgi:hypothetical protein